jgi:hypothetical protein
MGTPAEERAAEIHAAKVYLAEAWKRGPGTRMHTTLLQWAANARRRAMLIKPEPAQGDLFSGAKR